MNLKQPSAWMAGSLAAVFAALLGLYLTTLPLRVWPTPAWHDEGLRLYRDDVDLKVYYRFSEWASVGGVPYAQGFEQAYPPLAAAYFALPRLLTADFDVYKKIFVLQNAALFGLLVGLSVWTLRRFRRPVRLAALLFLPSCLYYALWRYDVLPAALVALLIWSFIREKYPLTFFFLAAAAAAKVYPAAFFLPLLMYIGARRLSAEDSRRLARSLIIMIAAAAALTAVLAWFSGFGLLTETLVMHLTRKFEIGSLAAVIITGLSKLHVSADIGLRSVSLLLVLLQMAAPIRLIFKGRLRDPAGFIRGCLFILLPLILFNRFYSGQWLLWITPLYLLVARRREIIGLVVFDLVNYIQFPIVYGIDPFGSAFIVSTIAFSASLGYLTWANFRAMAEAGYLGGAAAGPLPAPAAASDSGAS